MFIVLAFCNMFMTFLCTMPALSSTLRVVRDDQRSFALGIQWIKVRILGTIPAPMVFGALIDDTCILWNETCDGRGACFVYDNYYMSRLANYTMVSNMNCRLVFFKFSNMIFLYVYLSQVHARTGIHRESGFASFLFLSMVDIRRYRPEFSTANDGYFNAK